MLGLAFALRGTLTPLHGCERNAFTALVVERSAALGRPLPAQTAAVAERLFPGGVVELPSPERLAEETVALLDDHIAGGVLVARFRQLADREVSRTVAAPHVRVMLERIESLGIPSAVLCNGWTRIAQRETAAAGFSGRVIVSEDIGHAKPSAHAFAALVEAIALPPDRIWYVGNDPVRDIDGAARAGLQPIWLNESGAPYPSDLEPPMLTIATLDDLLEPLAEEYTRSLLSLRHLMRTALEWRPGHFLPPPDRW
jgi:FMN phosphatase YigB (HAD superfamily)